MIYFLFFLSGFSALIYQLVWVRIFGNVFGNTIYSASLVVAVFMSGLGAGSYLFGAWADRRYAASPHRLLRAYALVECAIALVALGISMVLPHLSDLSAAVSSYTRDANGWYVISTGSYVVRVVIAIVLLTPITLLMGATLTLLIRHLTHADLDAGRWRIAVLYAVNTMGAAVGAWVTDFALVPAIGLQQTQLLAVLCNAVAGAGAWMLVALAPPATSPKGTTDTTSRKGRRDRRRSDSRAPLYGAAERPDSGAPLYGAPVVLTAATLFLSGFAAMGMEIVWFRHFSIVLGGFRAVFSLLLTVILTGIGAGSLLGGVVHRRTQRPAECLIVVQALFVISTLAGIVATDGSQIDQQLAAESLRQLSAVAAPDRGMAWGRTLAEAMFNIRPIVIEVGVAALLMGFTFPLANAIVQRAELAVGRRAGLLYLANTAGAVCGSLVAGFLLLPGIGIQHSAAALMMVASAAVVPLYFATRVDAARWLMPALLASAGAITVWVLLPSQYVLTRALPRPANNERVIAVAEGLTEVIAVREEQGVGRTLYTNGHPMSSTRALSQRYMRALAHIPLLAMDDPQRVLVIGFGVGNTTHAATLHPSVQRVDVADLSSGVLEHARLFEDVNRGVLRDPRVAVHVNDGRHHLQMQPAGTYDLITLEPPPPGYAGMAALYSREFYTLARSRLTAQGYVSQWLPAYQLPTDTALAMVRAFIDVFPGAVLISGSQSELLLLGRKGGAAQLDPDRVAAALSRSPAVTADLQRFDLGSVRDIAGTFVGSGDTLASATRNVAAVTDDFPIQEYGVRSLLQGGDAVPAALVDLGQVANWCPKCFVDGAPARVVQGLDTYLVLTALAYSASPGEIAAARELAERSGRRVMGSAYLGAMVPESAETHNTIGIALASAGDMEQAVVEFREALRLDPQSAATHWHLGAALASRGARQEAVAHLRRSVELDPGNELARSDLLALTVSNERQ